MAHMVWSLWFHVTHSCYASNIVLANLVNHQVFWHQMFSFVLILKKRHFYGVLRHFWWWGHVFGLFFGGCNGSRGVWGLLYFPCWVACGGGAWFLFFGGFLLVLTKLSFLWADCAPGYYSIEFRRFLRQLMRQLVYTMFISNNRPSLHLWLKENLVKHRKVWKYYETDCGLFGKALQFDSLAALRGFCYLNFFFRISWLFVYSKECRKYQTVKDRHSNFQRSSSFASVYLCGSTFSKVLLTSTETF